MITFPEQFGGIYVHVPYCVRRCPYCDFYSSADHSSIPEFLDCLALEMEMLGGTGLVYDSLYFGGGTPSVLGPGQIDRIIETAGKHFKINDDVETTLEVNPGTVTRDSLAEYRSAGINRLNIGVQSFNDANLKFLGRIHASAESGFSIKWARQAGFDNIGLDLIYGLPGQDKKNWIGDLDRAIHSEVEHLSCYILTCESGTPLSQDVYGGRVKLPPGESVRELFDVTIDHLSNHGYRQYEISNFARQTAEDAPALESRHNQKYWSFAPYVGLGPSAHSFSAPERCWNHRNIETYVRHIKDGQLPIAEKESLTRDQLIMEAIYLGLRTARGIDLDGFESLSGIRFETAFKTEIAKLINEDLVDISHNHCTLTARGLAYHNSVVAVFTNQDIG